jgi:hypothetical protein
MLALGLLAASMLASGKDNARQALTAQIEPEAKGYCQSVHESDME